MVLYKKLCQGNSMGLEVDDDDDEELVDEHRKELSTEELLEENETLKWSLATEESGEDEDKEESRIIPAKDLKDVFWCWNKLSKLVEDYHPDVASVEKGLSIFNDTVMSHFWESLLCGVAAAVTTPTHVWLVWSTLSLPGLMMVNVNTVGEVACASLCPPSRSSSGSPPPPWAQPSWAPTAVVVSCCPAPRHTPPPVPPSLHTHLHSLTPHTPRATHGSPPPTYSTITSLPTWKLCDVW
ncbi:putative Tigger transposable element-derived protein 1-like 325 [Homarus americanus]|uniref:Putative Tigger transposable element-derived protein 1-like 325 n=1 Tax=Homarus americanus TaxID=6706 RepID=A0A8J5JN37_HOMAM|nr:putative Tigger transposable element-derived protein 1-like 325 [Homarus americanus]